MASTFVIDTCVLLADPASLLQFDEHDVVLPLVVVEELDRMKTRLDEIGVNASELEFGDPITVELKGLAGTHQLQPLVWS